ncbi:uncharacterized protein LOC111100108 [Crassostrea virginica]
MIGAVKLMIEDPLLIEWIDATAYPENPANPQYLYIIRCQTFKEASNRSPNVQRALGVDTGCANSQADTSDVIHAAFTHITHQFFKRIACCPSRVLGFDLCKPNPCFNGGECKVDPHALSQIVIYCKCPVEWKGDNCEIESKVFVLRHDFIYRTDLRVTGDLVTWPEIGANGEAWIGVVRQNGTFKITLPDLFSDGSSVQCVKFQYQVKKPETTLDVYTTVQGTTRYHWRSATVAPVYERWQQVLVDFQPALVANGSGLTIAGTSSSGLLWIDEILIVDKACSDL